MGSYTVNGYLYKPSYGETGRDTTTKFNGGMDLIDAYMANQAYEALDFVNNTLADIISDIGSDPVTILFPTSTINIEEDTTVPTNIALTIPIGCTIHVADTYTLTINGSMSAGLYQIFTFTGSGKVEFGPSAVREFYPVWWGATGDGATDDVVAIQSAIDAAGSAGGGDVILLPGNYLISEGIKIGDAPDGDTWSTYDGVALIGTAPAYGLWSGSPTSSPINIITNFSAPDWAITIAGPIMGWEVKGLSITCTDDSNAYGLLLKSCTGGSCSDILITNCENTSVRLQPQDTGPNVSQNTLSRMFIYLPSGAASAVGVELLGSASIANTSINTFNQLHITMTNVGQTGVELQYCDTNTFNDLDFQPCGGYALHFNYGITSAFPGGNVFNNLNMNDNTVITTDTPPTTGFTNNYIWLNTGGGCNPAENPGVRYGAIVRSFARIHLDGAQSIDGTGDVVAFDTVSYDPDSITDVANNLIQVKVAGYYRVTSQVTVTAAGGASAVVAKLWKNGDTDLAKATGSNNGVAISVPVTTTTWFDSLDWVQVYVTISAGSTALTPGTLWTWIEVEGPL